jgi:acyl-CoA reductase-like NAD-dependent aldehyde dehydrogenase
MLPTPSTSPHDIRRLLIGGEWVDGSSSSEILSPYSGDPVGRTVCGGARDARAAVDAAATALQDPLTQDYRALLLERIASGLERRAEEAAQTICAEAGKPISAARVEVQRAISTYTIAAAHARTATGEVVPMEASEAGRGKIGFTVRVPIGVVAAITPFNFPLNLAAHKLAPALAAGCPVVLKPAAKTPLSALLLADVYVENDVPAGWLNVVIGSAREIGDVFVEDPRVKLITFTGSAKVGWDLHQRAVRKRVKLELGNVTPAIVADDADLDDAATRLARGAFGFAGQSCISVQRVFVQTSVRQEFERLFVERVEALRVGDPSDERVDVGPLISSTELQRVRSWIEEARGAGASVVTGGDVRDGVLLPTVVSDVPPDARLATDEVFGPVCTIDSFEALDEALAAANRSRYGLQAGIFTRSLTSAVRATRSLEYGAVLVNEAPTFRADQMPYGGIKDSGNAREGPAWAIKDMTEERLVVLHAPT